MRYFTEWDLHPVEVSKKEFDDDVKNVVGSGDYEYDIIEEDGAMCLVVY